MKSWVWKLGWKIIEQVFRTRPMPTNGNTFGEFRNLGEMLQDVALFGRNGVLSDRLSRAATGLSEGTGSEGGFLVG